MAPCSASENLTLVQMEDEKIAQETRGSDEKSWLWG